VPKKVHRYSSGFKFRLKEDGMVRPEAKNLDSPDETRPFADKGKADIVKLGGVTVGRAVFEPGWKWSEHVKPIAGTESCQSSHTGYVISGRQHILMDDGTELDLNPGDAFVIPPGHDGWVVGDEPAVALDFTGMEQYAKRA
jgi:quercetin dioxygenase-like cupin family protein